MTYSRKAIPRDDRAWPRGALSISLVVVLCAVGIGVGLAVAAADRSASIVAAVLGGFAVSFGFGVAILVLDARRLIAGHPAPGWFKPLQFVGAFLCCSVPFAFDVSVGWAMVAGMFGGLMFANALMIRLARKNRTLVDEAEAAERATLLAAPEDARGPLVGDQSTHMNKATVGHVLQAIIGLERQRLLGWLISGAVVTTVSLFLDAPEPVTVMIVVGAVLALLLVSRRLWGTWLAHRDYMKGATLPRRAFVVLLHDPAPKMIRPLLGIWSEPPLVRGGRIPTPERVYRCDDQLNALKCLHDRVVVHEAWVDTGPRPTSKPRWVAADVGIALPQRRSLFGRWYMSGLIGGSRPRPYERLTLQLPHPSTEPAVETAAAPGRLFAAVGWRLSGLLALGLLMYWTT